MTLEKFVKKNRKQIDRVIKRIWPRVKPLNDVERKVWVLYEMSFLPWIEAERVRINEEWEGVYRYESFLSQHVRGGEESQE